MIPESLQDNADIAALEVAFCGVVSEATLDRGELTLVVNAAQIVEVSRFLLTQQKYVRLSAVTAVDWMPREPRFDVVYHLHSLARNARLRIKCRVGGEQPAIDSVTPVWPGANWYEREVLDLFGIAFNNHPDPRRIMMPENWKGHPLRKDYPVHGYKYSYQDQH
jgi:NADH-quinone oxidoreductase subunit C